jgi:hypothetical protein
MMNCTFTPSPKLQRLLDCYEEAFEKRHHLVRDVQVNGRWFEVAPSFELRCTLACDESGRVEQISSGGYISADLTVRKAIAAHFGLPTFRKNAKKAS